MGRNKTPDEIKKLRGTDQPCRMSPVAVGFSKPHTVPKIKGLKADAKKIFANIAQELINCNVLDSVSVPLLAAYANEISIYYKLMLEVEAEGYTVYEATKHGGKIKINPKRMAAVQALQVAKTIAGDFGFTPATKAKIAAIISGTLPKDDNEFTEFEKL